MIFIVYKSLWIKTSATKKKEVIIETIHKMSYFTYMNAVDIAILCEYEGNTDTNSGCLSSFEHMAIYTQPLSVSMMKCVSCQDVSMREGLHLCKSSSQLAYLLCWRDREVRRTTSVLFICVSKLLSPAVCSTLTSVKGKTLFLWQPLCCCNRKCLCLSSGAVRAHSHTHFIHVSPCVIFLNKYCFGVLLYFLNLLYVPWVLWAGGNLCTVYPFLPDAFKVSLCACVQIFNALQLGKALKGEMRMSESEIDGLCFSRGGFCALCLEPWAFSSSSIKENLKCASWPLFI